jgi:hypothetical protein
VRSNGKADSVARQTDSTIPVHRLISKRLVSKYQKFQQAEQKQAYKPCNA